MQSNPLFALAKTLIDIESITGNEADMSDFLEAHLRKMGFRIQSQIVENSRRNLVATTGATPRVVLCTHIDTVPPFFPATEDDSDIHGRGACDTKGIIAAMLQAGEKLLQANIREFGFLFVVGEETDSVGAKKSNALAGETDFIIVGEPTGNKLGLGHKGLLGVKLKATGRACHSAFPELGNSAVEQLLDSLDTIRRLDFGSDPELGDCTLNIGKIEGGRAHNIVPDFAQAEISIRAALPTGQLLKRLQDNISEKIELTIFTCGEPQKMHVLPGYDTTVLPFGTDIPYLKSWGRPLLLGPGDCRVAHTAEERVPKKELEDAVAIYTEVVKKLIMERL